MQEISRQPVHNSDSGQFECWRGLAGIEKSARLWESDRGIWLLQRVVHGQSELNDNMGVNID
jgi:hypothetical protein